MRVRSNIHPVVPRSRISAGRHTAPGVVDTYRGVEVSQAACPRGVKNSLPNPECCLTEGCPRHEPRLYVGQHRRDDVVSYPFDVRAHRDVTTCSGDSLSWSVTIKGCTYGFGFSPDEARIDALRNYTLEDSDSYDDGS